MIFLGSNRMHLQVQRKAFNMLVPSVSAPVHLISSVRVVTVHRLASMVDGRWSVMKNRRIVSWPINIASAEGKKRKTELACVKTIR